jgi:hypothetical protein
MKKIITFILTIFTLTSGLWGQHFTPVWTGNGVDHENFYFSKATVDNIDLEANDEIAIFDGSYCVGAAVLTQPLSTSNYLSIIASKDDDVTTEVDGYTPGNTISYKIWDNSASKEITIITVNYLSGSGSFVVGGTVSAELAGEATRLDVTPLSYDVNPYSGQVVFTVDANTSWSVTANDSWITPAKVSETTLNADYTINTGTARTGTIEITGGDITRTLTINQEGPTLQITPTSGTLPWGQSTLDGGTGTWSPSVEFTVTSNLTWDINDLSSNQTWLGFDVYTGIPDKFVAYANTDNDDVPNDGVITLNITEFTINSSVDVHQEGAPVLTVSVPNLSLAFPGGSTGSFDISAKNVTWDITWDNVAAPWVSVNPTTGTDDQTITVTANTENSNTAARSVILTVSGGGITHDVLVTQEGSPLLEVDSTSLGIAWDNGSSNSFKVTSANTSWTINNTPTWLSISPLNGTETQGISITAIEANPSTTNRTVTLAVTGSSITRSVTVTQAGAPLLETDSSSISLAYQINSENTFTVTSANVSWNVTGIPTWLSVVPASGNTTQLIRVQATSENSSTIARTATLTITDGNLSQTVNVSQAGAPSLDVNPTNISMSSNGGSSGSFNITSANLTWVITGIPTWADLTPVTSGNGDQTITVTTNSANSSTDPRSATLTISGGGITHTVDITQEGASVLSVNPSSINLTYQINSFGTFSINAANVTWRIEDIPAWLNVSPALTGTSSQITTVTATEDNPTTSSRSATLTITDDNITRTVIVTQDGAPLLEVDSASINLGYQNSSESSFTVTSENISWNITGIPTWLSVTPDNGSSTQLISVSATEENPSTSARTVTLTVTDNNLTQTLTVTQAGKPSLEVGTTNVAIGYKDGSNESFLVISFNLTWTITGKPDWLDVSPLSGGNQTNTNISLTAIGDNPTSAERTATLIITGGGISKTVTVTQSGAPELTVDQTTMSIGYETGLSSTFELTSANVNWTISVDATWLGVNPASGSTSQTITITTTEENPATSSRNATITITGGEITRTISVTQDGAPLLEVSPSGINLSWQNGSSSTINITSANVNWIVSGTPSWISANPLSGSGNQTLTVTASSDNPTSSQRSASFTISGGGITRTVSVSQDGAPLLEVSTTTLNLGNQSGSNGTFTITSANNSWSISDDATWFSASPVSGSSTQTITVTTSSENTSTVARQGTITVTDGTLTRTVAVSQQGADPVLSVDPLSRNVDANSGIATYTVSSNVDWTITENSDWLAATKLDNSTLSVTYNENLSVNQRSATITLSGPGVSDVSVTLIQAGATPYLTVDPLSSTVSSASGTVIFTVSSNIIWSVTDDAGWANPVKTNDQTLTVNYDENTVVSARTATITLSGTDVDDVVLSLNQEAATPVLTVDPSSRNVDAQAGTVTFTVTSNINWTFSETADWVSGTKTNNTTLTIDYTENPEVTSRNVIITLSGPGVSDQSVSLTQAGATPVLSVSPSSANVSPAAGTATFTVTSNIDWNISENTSWLTATKTNNTTLTVTYDENISVDARSAVITLSGTGVSDQTVTVNQAGATPVLSVTPASQNVTSAAGSITFTVNSNQDWSFTENSDWFSASKTDNSTLTVTYNENLIVDQRSAIITISGNNVSDQTATVVQEGADPVLDVTPSSQTVSSSAGSFNFTVSSNINWTFSENADWITATKTDNTTLTVTYNENTVVSARTANITISGTGVSNQTVSLSQEAATPVLNVDPNSQTVGSSSGSVTFTVNSNVNWTISENATWFSAVKTNNQTITINYDENTAVNSRSANITITGPGVSNQTVSLNQQGANPELSVTPASRTVSSPGGTTNFSVTSNVSWSASEDADWLTVTKTSEQTLTVNYDENITVNSRSATITISGPGITSQNVLVTQEGATPALSVTPASRSVNASSGTVTYTVTSNIDWAISENSDWLSATKTSNSTLTVSYDENITVESRTASVTLSGTGVSSQTVSLDQEGATPVLSVDPGSASVSSEAGSVSFAVTSNIVWTFSESSDWLSALKTDNSTLTITYEANISVEGRSAVITLSGPGVTSRTVTVNQQGATPALSVDPTSASVSPASGTHAFTVSSNINWNVSENADWLTATKDDNSTITVTYIENLSVVDRNTSITVSGPGVSDVIINFSQDGATPVLSAEPTTVNADAGTGSVTYNITSNINWTFAENEDWLTATKTNETTLTVTYDENVVVAVRSGLITLSGPGVSDVEITLNQQAAAPVLSVDPVSKTVTTEAGTTTFAVTSNIDWNISENADWIIATKTDDATLTISYDENTIPSERVASIILSGEGVSPQTVTLTQEAAEPVLTVSPGSFDISSSSGTVTFTVTSNVDWSFNEDSEWLTAIKSGENSLIVTYSENESVIPRSANINITGPGVTTRIVSINQDGATPVLTVTPTSAELTSPTGAIDFTVTSNIDWAVSESSGWLTAVKTDESTLHVVYDENLSVETRTAVVTLSGPGVTDQTVTLNQEGAAPMLSVTPETEISGPEAGVVTFTVNSNINWTATENSDWIIATKTNNTVLTVTIEENLSVETRTAVITLSGPGVTPVTVTINQHGAVPVLNVDPITKTVSANAGTTDFSVASNIDWNISENSDWLIAVKTNNSTLTISYNENMEVSSRSASITLSGPNVTSVIVTLNQDGATPVLSVTPSSADVSASPGTVDFTVTSNIEWTLSEDSDWFIAQKVDDNTLRVNYVENLSVIARSATVTLSGSGVSSRTVSINQQGATPFLTVTPQTATVSPVSGSMTFTVSSNIDWSVSINATWFTVTKTDNSTLVVNYDANATVNPRNAEITLSGPGVSNQIISFAQEGEDPVLTVIPHSTTVNSSSGSYSFTVNSNINWTITEDVIWITASKTNETTFTVNYEENTLVSSRSATMVISGPGVESITVTLNQQGANPELSVDPPSVSVQANSGSVNFTVTSNINWSVTESSEWLTASKSNANIIIVTYNENTSVDSRSSTVTVSGPGVSSQIVTVTQVGATPVLTINPSSRSVGADAGTVSFDIQSNVDWSFSENTDWFVASKPDANTLLLTFDENLLVNTRSAGITISGPGISNQVVSLSQEGAAPVLTADPTSAEVSSEAGSVSFNITSNIYWNYSETIDWIQIIQSDYNTLTVNYDANNSADARTGIITLSGPGVSLIDITVTQNAQNAILKIQPSSATVTSYPGSVSINVNSNIDWNFEVNSDWLSVSKTNNSTLVINYYLNSGFESRTATITLTGPGVDAVSYTLTQAGADPVLKVYQPFANVPATSGTVTFSVRSNVDWVITENFDWLTAEKTNSSILTIHYDLNLLFESRTAEVTLSGTGVDDQIVTITQEKSGAILIVNPAEKTIEPSAGSIDFDVSSNIIWNISENVDWIEAVKESENVLRITYEENLLTDSRTATITLSGEGVNPVTVTLSQSGASPFISIDRNTETVGSSSGNLSFTVHSNIDWSISENSDWLVAIKSDNTTLTVSYNENMQITPRAASIVLTGTGAAAVTLNINQQGTSVVLEVSPSSTTVSADSGTFTFTVNSNIVWSVSTDQDWLTVTKINETSFDATFKEQTETSSRTSPIIISGEGASPVTVSLTQEAPVGIETMTPEVSFKIYPNPAIDFVNLEIIDLFKEKIIIEIFNRTGQKLYEKVYSFPPAVITENYNFSDWPKGEYYLRIHDGKEWQAVKIFILQ